MNPFTGQDWKNKELRATLDKLPAAQHIADFEKAYLKNQVTVVKAETGAGKGVIISPHIMLIENIPKFSGFGKKYDKLIDKPRKVVVTEPRTVNTEIAKFISKAIDAPGYVNYAYRFNNNVTDKTLLAFVTDGFLLNLFYADTMDYSVVIIDEVHERNTNIDQLLTFCKDWLEKDKSRKLVLLSATINPKDYTKYFNNVSSAVVEIPGRSYPVKSIYTKVHVDYMEESINIVEDIVETSTDGDILCFLASGNELRESCRKVAKRETLKHVACFELYRGIPEAVKDKIIDKSAYRTADKSRKLVFSTNIAESGVTVEGIKYVIESGVRYESRFNALLGVYDLSRRYISRAEAEQRKGRAGRTQPGICYHLYTKEQYEKEFDENKSPEILITDITGVLFNLMNKFTLGESLKFLKKMPAPPSKEQFGYASGLLSKLGLVSGNNLSQLGEICVNIPLDPQHTVVLIAAKCLNLHRDVALIMACLSIEPQINKWFVDKETIPPPIKKKYNAAIKKFSNAKGEIFSFYKILDKFLGKDKKKRSKFCYDNFLIYSTVDKARKVFFKLIGIIKRMNFADNIMNIRVVPDNHDEGIILAFAAGYHWNRAEKVKNLYKLHSIKLSPIELMVPLTMSRVANHIMYLDAKLIEGIMKLGGVINLTDKLMEKIDYMIK